jgi:hypothetical protein
MMAMRAIWRLVELGLKARKNDKDASGRRGFDRCYLGRLLHLLRHFCTTPN